MLDITEAYKSIREAILENRGINVAPRSVTNDMFVMPLAIESTKLKTLIGFISKLQSFDSMLSMLQDTAFLEEVAEALNATVTEVKSVISTTLDKLASNFNKTRKTAVYGTSIVSFYRYTAPTDEDLAKVLSIGTTVTSTSGVSYSTTAEQSYSAIYYDTTYNAFMLDVAVQCDNAGTIGNTDTDTIKNLSSASDWQGVTNKVAVVNGRDAETDEELATRLKTEISGTNTGSYNGIKNLLLQNTPVNDLVLVGAGDPNMRRDQGWGGMTDVYIADNVLEQVTWEFVADGESITYIKGPRPLRTEGAISVSGAGAAVLRNGVMDTETPYAGSIESRDYIMWTTPPAAGTTVTLTYFRNKRVQEVQDFINQDDYNTGGNILIKQAREVLIDILFTIVVSSGYYKSNIITAIKSTLIEKIDSLRMGAGLDQSDMVNWVTDIVGIDRVVLPLTKFNRTALTGSVDSILVNPDEYIRVNKILIS